MCAACCLTTYGRVRYIALKSSLRACSYRYKPERFGESCDDVEEINHENIPTTSRLYHQRGEKQGEVNRGTENGSRRKRNNAHLQTTAPMFTRLIRCSRQRFQRVCCDRLQVPCCYYSLSWTSHLCTNSEFRGPTAYDADPTNGCRASDACMRYANIASCTS